MKMNNRLNRCLVVIALLTMVPPFTPLPAQTVPGDATFMVTSGAFPWTDRMNVWQLADIPSKLEGNGPLPQQSCGSRMIVLPDGAKYVIFAISNKDIDAFKVDYPDAEKTGDTINVVHSDGTGTIPYTILKLKNPPTNLGDKKLLAGLILLQINDKKGSDLSGTPPSGPSAPAK